MKTKITNPKKKKVLFICGAVGVCILILLALWVDKMYPKWGFEKNLKAVASYVFVMPDPYMNDAFMEFKENGLDANQDLPDMYTGMDENLPQYFTADYYEKFRLGWNIKGMDYLCGTEYTTTVKSVEVEDYSDNQSKFIATLSLESPTTQPQELILSGTARSDEKGKIEFWRLTVDAEATLAKLKEEVGYKFD